MELAIRTSSTTTSTPVDLPTARTSFPSLLAPNGVLISEHCQPQPDLRGSKMPQKPMLASCSQDELDTPFGPRNHQTFLQSTKKKESVLETLGSSTQMADSIFSSMSVYLRITRSIVVHHRPSCRSLMRQRPPDKEPLSSRLLLSLGVHQSGRT